MAIYDGGMTDWGSMAYLANALSSNPATTPTTLSSLLGRLISTPTTATTPTAATGGLGFTDWPATTANTVNGAVPATGLTTPFSSGARRRRQGL